MSRSLLAVVDFKQELILNSNTGATIDSKFPNPASIINVFLPNIFLFGGLIIFVMLVFGGITIVASGGDPKGLEKGSKTIQTAPIGFLLVIFGAGFDILNPAI